MILKKRKKTDSRKHYRDMAIQFGEQYGAQVAEMFMWPAGSKEYTELQLNASMTFAKMMEYVNQARQLIPTPDYET